jgi:phosphopantothenoylcysteine decarboxylase/phosphopantothenate--cysteine ligase
MAKILIGVTGCIAAYKVADLASALTYNGHEVKIIMTEAAKRFITPLTLATLSGNPVYDDSVEWALSPDPSVKHISLAKWCNMLVVCPATANTIAKMTHGMADNLLTSTYIALPKQQVHGVITTATPVLICPAMNTMMWLDRTMQENISDLRVRSNIRVLDPVEGRLACGDIGKGKLPKVPDIIKAIENLIPNKPNER